MKAKQYYEGVVRTFNSDLSRKFESQKVAMAGEIQQLETKLATLMQQQTSDCQRTPDPDLSLGSLGQNEERRRTLDPDLSLGGLGHNEERRRMESVRELLTTTSDGVNKDVIALVSVVQLILLISYALRQETLSFERGVRLFAPDEVRHG